MEDEYQALQWLTEEELVALARRTIRSVNLLDRAAVDVAVVEAELQRTLMLVRRVQDERRR